MNFNKTGISTELFAERIRGNYREENMRCVKCDQITSPMVYHSRGGLCTLCMGKEEVKK
jgi:hypothetical protein